MTRYPLYRTPVRKLSLSPGFDPRTAQSVASRYTDCAITAHETPVPFRITLRLCCQHTHDDRAHLFISSHHTCYTHGDAITCLLVTLTVLLVTGGSDILACHISTRAAFICRAFTGIIILCTKVGWGAFRTQCLDLHLQDFDVQRAACLRGKGKKLFLQIRVQSQQRRKIVQTEAWTTQGKTGTAVGSDQIYGWDRIVTRCATVWRHSCAAHGRHELKKSSLKDLLIR